MVTVVKWKEQSSLLKCRFCVSGQSGCLWVNGYSGSRYWAEDLGTVGFLWGILVPWWGATIPQKSKKRTTGWCIPVSPEMREAGSGYHSILVKRQKPIHQCPTQDRTKGLMGGEKTLQGAPDSCITALFPASPQRQCMQLMGSLSGEITLASSLHLTK